MIDSTVLGFALAAGLVAALNPCGFALLPAYLGMVIAGASREASPSGAVVRALSVTAVMSTGFLTVFGTFGLVVAPVIATAQLYLPFATVVIGAVLIGLGLWLLSGRELTILVPRLGGDPGTSTPLSAAYGYGISYATASLSCTAAPFLAVIGTTFDRGSVFTGILAFLAYAAGMTLTVGIAAVAVAIVGSPSAMALRRVLPYVGRIASVLVLATGLYVTYYGYYEIRLFFLDGSTQDPLIQAASEIQNWLSHQVGALGVWPLVRALLLVVAAAEGWRRVARRGRASATLDRDDSAAAQDGS